MTWNTGSDGDQQIRIQIRCPHVAYPVFHLLSLPAFVTFELKISGYDRCLKSRRLFSYTPQTHIDHASILVQALQVLAGFRAIAMGLEAALLVLGVSTFGTATACNGNSAFCDLPLTQAGICHVK